MSSSVCLDIMILMHNLLSRRTIYFNNTHRPKGEILESNVSIGHNWCQDAGIYEFTMAPSGDKVRGRYSFVYVWEDDQWKISHHHSSVMPEAFLGPAPKPVVNTEEKKSE